MYAIVKDLTVINLVIWDGLTPYEVEKGCSLIEASENVKIGTKYENGSFVIENVILPSEESSALEKITKLESLVTPRRIREAVLTDNGKIWLQSIEDQIIILRQQLD